MENKEQQESEIDHKIQKLKTIYETKSDTNKKLRDCNTLFYIIYSIY